MSDIEITELVKFEVERIDAVESPASGFPTLMMKGLGAPEPVAKGARDCPKCSKNYDADHQGSKCENCGTDLPGAPAAKAADDKVSCPTCDGDGKVMAGKRDCPDCDASGKVSPDKAKALAAKSLLTAEYEDRLAWVAKGGRNYSAGERKEMADDGRALPDGSYPINDEHDLHSAAILQRSGHGDVAAAAKHIGKRAKELGVANPLDGDGAAGKSQIAPGGATVDTGTQETGGLTKAVEDAIAKANAPLQERIKALDAELAKVKAQPVPGGPVLSRNVQVKAPDSVAREDYAAKAAYYDDQAALWDSQDRVTADGYRKMAREAREKAVTPAS